MPIVSINYWAVIVATVASMVIGSIWYAPPVLGNAWMKLIGKNKDDLSKGRGPAYFGMLVLSFIMSFILAHFVQYANATDISTGIQTGLWVWLGFVVTVMGGDFLFSKKPMKLFFIGAGYQLVQIVVMSVILAMWQ